MEVSEEETQESIKTREEIVENTQIPKKKKKLNKT